MNMKHYQNPQISICIIDESDILTVSGLGSTDFVKTFDISELSDL